jgi:predicted secreted protein
MRIIRNSGSTLLILVLLTILSKSMAIAGDYASREIIGFSTDGKYFAFEQFGVQDGSGFPYSEIFVIDTLKDQWVSGSPVRKRIDDEKATLVQVRTLAANAARSMLKKLGISEPGDLLASNPRPEVPFPRPLNDDMARYTVTINTAYKAVPPMDEPLSFRLDEKPLESPECAQYTSSPTKGFTLYAVKTRPNPLAKEDLPSERHILHDDESLPDSRGCTLGYAISDIVSRQSGDTTTYAVLLHMATVGFEGPDSRYLAITKRISQ